MLGLFTQNINSGILILLFLGLLIMGIALWFIHRNQRKSVEDLKQAQHDLLAVQNLMKDSSTEKIPTASFDHVETSHAPTPSTPTPTPTPAPAPEKETKSEEPTLEEKLVDSEDEEEVVEIDTQDVKVEDSDSDEELLSE